MRSKYDSTIYNLKILPAYMLLSLQPDQITYLDPIKHVSDPDVDSFVENFSIQITEPDCERI